MKILISGASGFIGNELINFLRTCGHHVSLLVRDHKAVTEGQFLWDPSKNLIDEAAFEGIDAVINLSGENIAGGRWSQERKNKILESRIQATSLLAKTLYKLKNPPSIFLSASAIGFYGDRGDNICNENTINGNGFLAHVCQEWEAAASPAIDKGIRTVFLRFGVVLSKNGGALAKMLLPFKLGLGGALGSGKQYMSWVAIDDVVAIILFALTNAAIEGPVNVVSPNPVTNYQFTKALGQALGRPTFFNVPAFVLRLILGAEMANEFLLSSTRVDPLKLTQEGYSFIYPDLLTALKRTG